MLRHKRKEARMRRRDGALEFYCHACLAWKDSSAFKDSRATCHACRLERRRKQNKRAPQQRKRRERARARAALVREADKVWNRKRKRKRDPWHSTAGLVPLEVVRGWMERAYALHAGDPLDKPHGWARVALVTGVPERSIYRLRNGESKSASVDIAESLASSIDAMDEFRELLTPGIEGWSPHGRYCERCGRYDIPHHALGYCRRCYNIVRWHKLKGQEAPLPKGERWSMRHPWCVMCGRAKYKHQGRGVCSGCYGRARKERLRAKEAT